LVDEATAIVQGETAALPMPIEAAEAGGLMRYQMTMRNLIVNSILF